MVCLDIGHWQNDSGATFGELREDKLAKGIVDRVKELCNSVGIKYIISSGSLSQRVNLANNQKCDIFVSVHINSFSQPVTGVETLIYDLDKNKTRYKLGSILNRHLVNESGLKNRGLKARNDLFVLRKTSMPSALVECGFINNDWSNVGERTEQFAQAIFKGLKEFYNISSPSKCPTCGK